MRVLVVSNTPWNTDNSFGNSYSNIFDGFDDLEFANIYCRHGSVNENKVVKSFQITEKSLIKNLINKSHPSGIDTTSANGTQLSNKEEKAYNTARKRRFAVYFMLRDLIWKVGRWKSKELVRFIDDFKPDLIFQPVYYSSYINDIVNFAKKHTNVPMLGYISDDCYTLRQFSLSPYFWLSRLFKRKKVKRTIEQCEVLYVISDIQKSEYEKIFTPPCKILTKCADFSKTAPTHKLPEDETSLIYAGNISKGRGESLSYITEAIERLNDEGVKIKLDIYSGTPLTEKLSEKLNKKGTVFHGRVPYSEVKKVEEATNILIHVEGLSLAERLAVHQSFSTKLVDFFEMGKCIFAVGSYDEAFAKHLIDNDAAVVASTKEEVYTKLKELVLNKERILEYGLKAYECGKNHHNKADIQSMIAEDIRKVVKS